MIPEIRPLTGFNKNHSMICQFEISKMFDKNFWRNKNVAQVSVPKNKERFERVGITERQRPSRIPMSWKTLITGKRSCDCDCDCKSSTQKKKRNKDNLFLLRFKLIKIVSDFRKAYNGACGYQRNCPLILQLCCGIDNSGKLRDFGNVHSEKWLSKMKHVSSMCENKSNDVIPNKLYRNRYYVYVLYF